MTRPLDSAHRDLRRRRVIKRLAYFGDYCFNLGNGGLAEEAAMMATWIRR